MSASVLPQVDWNRPGAADKAAPEAASVSDTRPAQPAFMARRRHDLLSRTVVDEIVPRLMLAQRPALQIVGAASHLEGDVAELTDLVLQQAFDVDGAVIARIGGREAGVEAMFLDLLTPVAHRLGEMWNEDLCNFVQVTVGLTRLQQILTMFSHPFAQEGARLQRAPRVLLVPGPGDQHSFGMAMVASFFQRAGWNGWSGVPESTLDLVARVRNEWFAVVGFSVSNEAKLEALTLAIRAVRRASRNREVGIMVGGPVFLAHPELVAMVGADATAADGRQAVQQAQRLLMLIPSRG